MSDGGLLAKRHPVFPAVDRWTQATDVKATMDHATYEWAYSLGSGSSNHVTVVRKHMEIDQHNVSLVGVQGRLHSYTLFPAC